jgi:hypothetical protein
MQQTGRHDYNNEQISDYMTVFLNITPVEEET